MSISIVICRCSCKTKQFYIVCILDMWLDHYDYPTEVQERPQAGDAHKEIDVTKVDNIDRDRSSYHLNHIEERHFDEWFQQWVKSMTQWPGALWFLTRYNKDQENTFAKVDTNDDGKISHAEYHADLKTPEHLWWNQLAQWFREHSTEILKEKFVNSEQMELDKVKVALKTIESEQYNEQSAFIDSNKHTLRDMKNTITAGNENLHVRATNESSLLATNEAINNATRDPFDYARQYQVQRNNKHGIMAT